jgi:SagB-type dehydrogenase family enzyme
MPELDNTTAVEFLKKSTLDRATIRNHKRPEVTPVERYKTYPEAEKIPLPLDWSLHEARILPLLQHRRAFRKYSSKSIELRELAFLLWAAQGVTAKMGDHFLRTSPSAGALYPIETYIVANTVENLPAGLYHFDVKQFQLERLSSEIRGTDAARVCLDQDFMAGASLMLFWTGILRRSMAKYGERGFRYLLLDAGHICQNTLMAAEAIGCGGCPVAAFYDEEANSLLGVDGMDETALYAASIGRK